VTKVKKITKNPRWEIKKYLAALQGLIENKISAGGCVAPAILYISGFCMGLKKSNIFAAQSNT
jgi:hypothetical protein